MLSLVSEINVGNLPQVLHECQRFRRHHLLVAGRKLEPRVSQDVFRRRSLVWVLVEYLEEKLLALPRDVLSKWQVLLANVGVQLFIILTFEWEPTA